MTESFAIEQFDYIVIGGGWGGMAFALLAGLAQKKVALFECHESLGGYGHCFQKSGYQFCANMHYFFDTLPGGVIDKFLKRVAIDKDITFEHLNKNGFDVVKVNDDRFAIPTGIENYRDHLIRSFPEQRKAIEKFFAIRDDVALITELFANKKLWDMVVKHPLKLLNFIRYFLKSSNHVLNQLDIHHHLRTILLARLPNFAIASHELPFSLLLLELSYYTTSATFPTKGMQHFINAISEKLIENRVKVFLNTEIKAIQQKNKRVYAVIDHLGKSYEAKRFISDIDPQETLQLSGYPCGIKYRYHYTYSCFSLYLGLKNITLSDYTLGNFNTWYYTSYELDQDCKHVLNELDYQKSFLFISTPSQHVTPGTLSPPGCHTMQVVLPANFDKITAIKEQSNISYELFKENIKNVVLNTLSAKFIPNIREYIEVEEFWSPLDLAKKVKTPCGALYGMRPDKRKLLFGVGNESPFSNLYFVGATAAYAGLAPVINGAMKLYDKLEA